MIDYALARRDFLRLSAAAAASAPMFARAADPLRIGFLSPLSGPLARVADTNRNALLMAIDEINAAGGLLGRKVEMVAEDSQMSVKVSLDKARKMIQRDGVTMITGMVLPFEREAAIQAAAGSESMVIHPNFDEGRCHAQLLTTGPATNQRVSPVIEWAAKNVGKRMAVLASDLGTNRQILVPQLEAAMKRHGGEVVSVRYFPFGTTDYGPVLQQIQALAPDFVWHSIGDDPLTFVKQYRSFGMRPQLVTDIMHESIAVTTQGASTGAIAVTSYMMNLQNAENRKFLDTYTARFPNSTPLRVSGRVVMLPMGECTYTGMRVYAQAVKAAGKTNVSAVKAALPSQEVMSPRGRVSVGADATHLMSSVFIGRVQSDNNFELLSTFAPVPAVCSVA